MNATKFTPFDTAEYLTSEEAIRAYLDAALELGDPDGVRQALGNIARAQSMSKVAERSGVPRESLYRAFSEKGNPELDTLFGMINALGITLRVGGFAPGALIASRASEPSRPMASAPRARRSATIVRTMKPKARAAKAMKVGAATKATARKKPRTTKRIAK